MPDYAAVVAVVDVPPGGGFVKRLEGTPSGRYVSLVDLIALFAKVKRNNPDDPAQQMWDVSEILSQIKEAR